MDNLIQFWLFCLGPLVSLLRKL